MPKVTTKTHTIKENMLKALIKTLGVVSVAAKSIGKTDLESESLRRQHYEWLKKDEDYAEQVASIENIALDFAESQLHKQIQNGEVASTLFYLKTKGKKRGYVERQEVEKINEEDKQVTISLPDGSTINIG